MSLTAGYLRKLSGPSRVSFTLSKIMLVFISAIGGSYAIDEIHQVGSVADKWFIVLLITATAILLVGEQVLRSHMLQAGFRFFQYSLIDGDKEKEQRYVKLINQIWASSPRVLFGTIYGTSVSSAALFLYERADQPRLMAWLAIFLFGVNFVTGGTLVSLFRFIKETPGLVRITRIDIWNMDNPTTEYIVDAYNLIAIFAVVYVSVSLTSIILSSLEINILVVSYGAFAICVLGMSMFFPYVPIITEAARQRADLMDQLATVINRYIQSGLVTGGYVDEKGAEIERLMRIRTAVEGLNLLPRRTRIIVSFLTVLVMPCIPLLAKIGLDTWWK